MSRTTTIAVCAMGFLAAGVALMCNDCEVTGFGCILVAALLAAEIPEVEE